MLKFKFGPKQKIAAAVIVVVAGGASWWRVSRPREITIDVFSDYAFRFNHADWQSVIDSRFRELNRIYDHAGTGIHWKVLNNGQADPTANISGVDNRRVALATRVESKADIMVDITGVPEGNRTGSANPFTRVAVVVDFPDKSDSQNALVLAHEVTRLFGVPEDPAWFNTVMTQSPDSAKMSDRTVKLIRQLRNYDFAVGVDGLLEGSWGDKAVDALAQADTTPNGNAKAHAHQVVATALLLDRRRPGAVAHLKEAVELSPKDAQLRAAYALALTRNEQDDEALTQLREAVRLAPDNPTFHQSLGAFLIKLHRTEEATEEIQTASRLDPTNAINQILLGTVLAMQMGRTDESAAAFQEALRLQPQAQIAAKDLEQLNLAKQKIQESVTAQRAAVQKAPADADAHYRLGLLEGRAGNFAEAIKEVQRSIDLRPAYGLAHTELASLYYVKGDYAGAWREIKKASDLGTHAPETLLENLKHKMPEPK